jgi:hypothetical protein
VGREERPRHCAALRDGIAAVGTIISATNIYGESFVIMAVQEYKKSVDMFHVYSTLIVGVSHVTRRK